MNILSKFHIFIILNMYLMIIFFRKTFLIYKKSNSNRITNYFNSVVAFALKSRPALLPNL